MTTLTSTSPSLLAAILAYSPAYGGREQEWTAAVQWALAQFDWARLGDRDLAPGCDDNLQIEGRTAYQLVAEQRVLFHGLDSFADSCDDALGEVGSWFGLDVRRRRHTAKDGRLYWDVVILREDGEKHPAGCDAAGHYRRNGWVELVDPASPHQLWVRSQNRREVAL